MERRNLFLLMSCHNNRMGCLINKFSEISIYGIVLFLLSFTVQATSKVLYFPADYNGSSGRPVDVANQAGFEAICEGADNVGAVRLPGLDLARGFSGGGTCELTSTRNTFNQEVEYIFLVDDTGVLSNYLQTQMRQKNLLQTIDGRNVIRPSMINFTESDSQQILNVLVVGETAYQQVAANESDWFANLSDNINQQGLVQQQPTPLQSGSTPPPHVASCPPVSLQSGTPTSIMSSSNRDALSHLNTAVQRLTSMRERVKKGEMYKIPPNHSDWKTLRAVQRQLHTHVGRREEFLRVTAKALNRIIDSVALTLGLVHHSGTNSISKCGNIPGEKKCVQAAAPINGDIAHCDLFMWRGPLCRRNINIHERFHMVSSPPVHGSTNDPEQTHKFIDNLVDVVIDVNEKPVESDCRLGN